MARAAGRPLRVLQVIPTLYPGGLEKVATTLALGLAARGDEVVVCSWGGEPYESQLRDAGISMRPIARPWPRPLPLARAALGIARAMRATRPDVVHAHNPAATAAATLARRLAGMPGTPVVSTCHGIADERVHRANRAHHRADVVVGVGPTSTGSLVAGGLDAERARTVLNAVDARPGRPAAEVREELGATGVPLVVTVGRYVEEKNQELLLEALARLDRPFKGLIVGHGPLEDALTARVGELGLTGRCVVTGKRMDAVDLVAAADVFGFSSRSEALPLAVIEAMAVGTPVVSTDVGSIGDLIEHGHTGLLVPSGDAEALAAAIGRLIDDAPLRERLARSAAARVEQRCSVAVMVDGYREAYADAIRLRRH